jgi:ABC-type transporter Mla MlaB component
MKLILAKECTFRQLLTKKERLEQALQKNFKTLTIEVNKLERIDTAFLQVLLSILKTCKNSGKKYKIKGNSKVLEEILGCYGICLEELKNAK